MQSLFYNCKNLKTVIFPDRLNMDNCCNLSHAFDGCTSLQNIDLSGWYFSKPDMEDIPGRFYLDLQRMFENCSSLTEIKMPKIYRAPSLFYTFNACENLVSADLSEMDMSMQTFFSDDDTDWAAGAFEGAMRLRTIKSPVNVLRKMSLPAAFMRSDGVRYTEFPKEKTESVTLTLDTSSTIPLESIDFYDDVGEIVINATDAYRIINMHFAPDNATYKAADITISDPSVIRYEKTNDVSFDIIPLKAGIATITATAKDGSGVSASLVVKVVDASTHVTSVKLDQTEVKLEVGKSITLHATVLPENAVNKRLEWRMGADCEGNISIAPSADTLSCTVTGLHTVSDARLSVSSVDSSDYDICFIDVIKSGGGDTPVPSSSVNLVKGQKMDISSLFSGAGYTLGKKSKLTVSDTKVASITKAGLVTAKAYAGSAQVLLDGTGTGIWIYTDVPTILEKTVPLTYVGQVFSSSGNITGTSGLTPRWEIPSSKNPVVSMDSYGNVTALKKGSVKVTAVFDNVGTKGSVKYSYTVKVNIPALSKDSLKVLTGAKGKLTVKNITKTQSVSWTSSNPSVVKVEPSGTNGASVIPVSSGTATVSAIIDGHSYDCAIEVPAPSSKKQVIYISRVGGTATVALKDTKLKNKQFVWTSDNPSIAKIDASTGKITGVSSGMTTVYGTYYDPDTGAACVSVYAGVEVK